MAGCQLLTLRNASPAGMVAVAVCVCATITTAAISLLLRRDRWLASLSFPNDHHAQQRLARPSCACVDLLIVIRAMRAWPIDRNPQSARSKHTQAHHAASRPHRRPDDVPDGFAEERLSSLAQTWNLNRILAPGDRNAQRRRNSSAPIPQDTMPIALNGSSESAWRSPSGYLNAPPSNHPVVSLGPSSSTTRTSPPDIG